MPQTLCEKILSKKARRPVWVGEYLELCPDVALANDVTAPPAIRGFYKAGGVRVKDPQQLVLMPDHFTPNKDIASAGQVKMMREFAREQGIGKYYEIGRMGIEHVVLPEEGLVRSGDLVVGADSHTCTYGGLGAFATGVGSTDLAGVFLAGLVWLRVPPSIRVIIRGEAFKGHASAKDLMLSLIGRIGVDGANYRVLEFFGPGLKAISIEGRMTMANMAIEAGAKTALFPVDDLTLAYERERGLDVEPLGADEDAVYESCIELDLGQLEPVAAMPFLPSNVCRIDDVTEQKLPVDQVVIGSCTNGRIEDLRAAAAVMKGFVVDPKVRCLIIPGSQRVYAQAMKEGIFDVFIHAQCAISTPTCGPCLGGHMGILAAGERAVATTNRNFVGRMGHPESEVILASPATAAATAVKGYLCGPAELNASN
jgi:3-isopropylmalate/(R)-2-methylmalate dehydratase large subunit